MADLLTNLRAHLRAQGVAQAPNDAGGLPPMFLEPRNGAPAPRDTVDGRVMPDVLLAAFYAPGIPPAPRTSFLRADMVDLRLRTWTAPQAVALEQQVRAALIDRRNWTMGAEVIVESLLSRDFTRLASGPQGFEYLTQYRFERYSGILTPA